MSKTKKELVRDLVDSRVESWVSDEVIDAIMEIFGADESTSTLFGRMGDVEEKVKALELKLSKLDRRLG